MSQVGLKPALQDSSLRTQPTRFRPVDVLLRRSTTCDLLPPPTATRLQDRRHAVQARRGRAPLPTLASPRSCRRSRLTVSARAAPGPDRLHLRTLASPPLTRPHAAV